MARELPDFTRIRNRNERRVAEALQAYLQAHPAWNPQDVDLEDVYAATLNRLPARYRQHGTVTLNEPVSDAQVHEALRDAIDQVLRHPLRPSS